MNFEKNHFSLLKMYFRYLGIRYQRSGTYKYFNFKVTASRVKRLKEQVGRP